MKIVFKNSDDTLVSIENATVGKWYILSDIGNKMNGVLFYCGRESNSYKKMLVSICEDDEATDVVIEGQHYIDYEVWKEVKQTVTVTVG